MSDNDEKSDGRAAVDGVNDAGKKKEEKQKDEKEELRDRMLRLAAEFDNYKKRAAAEMDKAKDIGRAELLKGLLPVLDDFELALEVANPEKENVFSKGIEMVYSNFIEVLKKEGLTEIKTDGVFDPYRHEIMLSRPDGKRKPGTILEVVKKGYAFRGIMLRPASVIVAKEAEAEKKD